MLNEIGQNDDGICEALLDTCCYTVIKSLCCVIFLILTIFCNSSCSSLHYRKSKIAQKIAHVNSLTYIAHINPLINTYSLNISC